MVKKCKVIPPKPKYGGFRQRANLQEDFEHSPLAELLLKSYFWGDISFPLVVQIARLAIKEKPRHEDLVRLSELDPDHASRSLESFLCKFPSEESVQMFKVPIKSSDPAGASNVDFAICMPHLLFATLFSKYNHIFEEQMFGGRRQNIQDFWNSQMDHPAYAGHDMHTHPRFNFEDSAIPLFVHGDDVASVGIGRVSTKAVDVLSWGSLLSSSKDSPFSHFIIWLLFNSLRSNKGSLQTMARLWKIFCYSCYWLYQGVFPDRDVDGNLYVSGLDAKRALTPLAGGFFAVIWNWRFDILWGSDQIRIARPMQGFPCNCCEANHTDLPWTECKYPGSKWIGTEWTRESYVGKFQQWVHRVFRTLPGMSPANHTPDPLHVKFLGSDQYFLGSAIKLLTHYWMPSSPANNLEILFDSIREEYNTLKVRSQHRYTNFKLSYFMPTKKSVSTLPKLKGTGMQCKALAKVFVSVFASYMDESDRNHQIVLIALKSLRRTNELYHSNRKVMRYPPADADELVKLSFEINQCTTALVRHYHSRSIPLFHYTMKHHYTLHCALVAKYSNPHHGDCGSGEVLMKTAKQLIKSCVSGQKMPGASRSAMRKYSLALHFEMDRTSRWWQKEQHKNKHRIMENICCFFVRAIR